MKKTILLFILFFLVLPYSALAEDKISVAVTINFATAFKEIAMDFEEKTGVKVESTFASTGSLYRQIKNGIPYDVFLAADEDGPAMLQREGWTEGTFIYARSRNILWSARQDLCKTATWRDALANGKIGKIAIADPATTPHGAAVKTALQKAGLWESLQEKLIHSRDIEQSFQYANTRIADAGFCAFSAAPSLQGNTGCYFEIPEAPAILQTGCILKNTGNKICAELFMVYLLSDQAVAIKKKYGYQ